MGVIVHRSHRSQTRAHIPEGGGYRGDGGQGVVPQPGQGKLRQDEDRHLENEHGLGAREDVGRHDTAVVANRAHGFRVYNPEHLVRGDL